MTLKNGKYQMYGDPKPDGTYQVQKTLWDGTNIQVSQRVGDEERMWVRDKLTRLHVAGFLTLAEYQARDSAAEVAITRPDLNKLIADLPKEENDWRKDREVPMDKALLKEAIEATSPQKVRLVNFFPLFIVLGMFAFLAGAIGLDAHTTTSMTAYAAVAAVMGIVSISAGLILAKMT